jgi:hypothetical protein
MGLEAAALLRAMQQTAPALARARVNLQWEFLQPKARGVCITTAEGVYLIGIDPRLSIGTLYQVFLHETAHAYIRSQRLAVTDHEAAARKIGGAWGSWIEPRNPANVYECIAWLERLRGYHWRNP